MNDTICELNEPQHSLLIHKHEYYSKLRLRINMRQVTKLRQNQVTR